MAIASRPQLATAPPSQSIMEDASDTESDPDLDAHLDPDQQQFYMRQQQQAMYYQQHQKQHGSSTDVTGPRRNSQEDADEEMYSDDDSSTASIPDDDINFELTYALHTFLATVEGQASVVKGDSLVLLDDANSYWWLVRVLKTEDVGYIPAENIETPYERLARLNKHRNVDLAAATQQEIQAGATQGKDRLKAMIRSSRRSDKSTDEASRRVIFAPPTYVDHPGVTWSSDEESEEGDDEVEDVEGEVDGGEQREGPYDGDDVDRSLDGMEPDDGVEWAKDSAEEEQRRLAPKSNNPFANRGPVQMVTSESDSSLASNSSTQLDPAHAGETRRITMTPSVAQGGPLLPSAIQANNDRTVSGQSSASMTSIMSAGSAKSDTPSSPEDSTKKGKKMKKGSKEDLGDGEKRRSKGVLSGLFSRNKDKKKGISSADSGADSNANPSADSRNESRLSARNSEDSVVQDEGVTSAPAGLGFRVQQRDQALQQAYTSKYLSKNDALNPTQSEAAVLAQNAALRSMNAGKRSSIILSPNPAGPPLLNVIRVFAGDHVKSDSSFKTVLLNETTSANDLIRQLMQRFRLQGDAGYYLTVKDVSGEEMELEPEEKPLAAFEEAVQRWTHDESDLRARTPTIKRSSISSISSIASLSSHPAIAKLGMNDYSDDSTVKIYLNRRRGMPEASSEFSSYSTQLSAVQESSPEMHSSQWSGSVSDTSDATISPPRAQPRYNPSLTIQTPGQVSPERYTSPSAKFTLQLMIQPADLPDGSVFDPSSEAIVSRQIARERPDHGAFPMDSRRRLFTLPRNATVVEAIEQGLERFGIVEGVVDGGDDVEDKVGNRRSMAKVRYSLAAYAHGQERPLSTSSKVLDAYTTLPQLRPVEKTTPEQRRRSRDLSVNAGFQADILPTDPVFILRRVPMRLPSEGPMQRQQASKPQPESNTRGQLSPQEIIAAQRAATRANQKALISAHVNKDQGVDVVLPDRGTVRSSRLLVPDGEVVRYSYIDGDGETYDISEILEEEWEDAKPSNVVSPLLAAPVLMRVPTDSSNYVTAPSTPEPTEDKRLGEKRGSRDILQGVLHQPDGQMEEKLHRVINKVKSAKAEEPGQTTPTRPADRGDMTPRASAREPSHHAAVQQTAVNVNRIISRHRQQPSIASIMSDLSASPAPESFREPSDSDERTRFDNDERTRFDNDERTRSSTPLTATSSSHPTPPFSSVNLFTRTISSTSPSPRNPVTYTDDFGIKTLMAIVDIRSRDTKPKRRAIECDEVERRLYGEKVDWEGVHGDVKGIFGSVSGRLDKFDRDVDELLASVLKTM